MGKQVPALSQNIEEIMQCLWKLERVTGRVNFHNFLEEMHCKHQELQKEASRIVFSIFDFDNSGAISQEEVEKALSLKEGRSAFEKGLNAAFGITIEEARQVFNLDESGDDLDFSSA